MHFITLFMIVVCSNQSIIKLTIQLYPVNSLVNQKKVSPYHF